MSSRVFEKKPLWLPDENSGRKMKAFKQFIEKKYNLFFSDHRNFHKWTVENIELFWGDLWNYFGVTTSEPYQKVVDSTCPMEESPRWFEGAKLNIAENLLKFRDDRTALIVAGEKRKAECISYRQMYEETRIYAAALKNAGLQKGDIVACYMSNRKEAVLAMLAVTSVGAIWTGSLPTFGTTAYLNRLKQVHPKFLFTVDEFPHNNEIHNLLGNIKEITNGLPSLEKVIIVASKPERKPKSIKEIKNSCFLDEFLRTAYTKDGILPELVFEQVSFSHPTYINFTSGTTGLPKTIVHGFGGLLPAVRDFCLHWDNDRDDVWLSVSPVGWVSWNMTIFLLFVGSTVALYEGQPYFLSPTYLWDLVDDLKITRMFIPPSILDEIESRNYLPTKEHHLTSLKMILSGSSVVKPRNYEFAFNKLKKDLQFAVRCGSTEVMGFCMVTDVTLPLYAGEISTPCLGVALECLDNEGNHILGKMGELAVSKPLPSLPLYFWNDQNGDYFKKSYFSKFKGKFTIGDSIIINPITRGIIVSGRSDETLKKKVGCRFGSSEIYNVVTLFPEIADSLCVGQYGKDRDERAVLFIQMKEGHIFCEDLIQKLKKRIMEELTDQHVPEIILQAPGIPHNANGKKTEIIVKKIINKMPFNRDTVYNSECLGFYHDIPELRDF